MLYQGWSVQSIYSMWQGDYVTSENRLEKSRSTMLDTLHSLTHDISMSVCLSPSLSSFLLPSPSGLLLWRSHAVTLKQLRERLMRMKPSTSSQGRTEPPTLCRGGSHHRSGSASPSPAFR